MKVSEEDEKKMAEYLKECWEFGTPLEKTLFADQVVHYMECIQVKNTFPNLKPG